MKITVDENKIIRLSIAMFRPDGTPSDYEGMATMRLEGSKLSWVGEMTQDPSNKNRIANHHFEGFVAPDHIYILETYDDILPNNQVDKRRNDIHIYFGGVGKAVMLGDVHINGELLVFARTVLIKYDER